MVDFLSNSETVRSSKVHFLDQMEIKAKILILNYIDIFNFASFFVFFFIKNFWISELAFCQKESEIEKKKPLKRNNESKSKIFYVMLHLKLI